MVPVNAPLFLAFAPALSFLSGIFPLGILLVAGLWWDFRVENKLADYTGRAILNHQITWGIAYVIIFIAGLSSSSSSMVLFWICWSFFSGWHFWKYLNKEYEWKSPVSFAFLKYGRLDDED